MSDKIDLSDIAFGRTPDALGTLAVGLARPVLHGATPGGLDGVLADFRPNARGPAPPHRVREPYIQGPLKPSRDRPACTSKTSARSPQSVPSPLPLTAPARAI